MPASMTQRSLLWSPLLHAGAYGTLHGGHPGEPAVGLTVPVQSSEEFTHTLETLKALNVQATLLIGAEVMRDRADDLWQTVRAGHEVAGLHLPLNYGRLEALAGAPVRYWALPSSGVTRGMLNTLQKAGLAPLPAPSLPGVSQQITPGAILRVPPQDLASTLPELKRLAYRPVPVGQLRELRPGTLRDVFQNVYQRVVEDRYAEREGIIDLSERFDAIMRVAPLDHAPPPLPLPPSTPTAELHVNSTRLVGLASGNLTATYKAYQRSLRDVALALETHPQLKEAQAVFAVTLFHAPLEKAGFRILDLPPLRARWYALGFRLLRIAYGTTRTPSENTPKMGWMPREKFLERYGQKK